MYQFICDFGSFAVGAGVIGYALYSIVNIYLDRQHEKEEEKRTREYYRKRGE